MNLIRTSFALIILLCCVSCTSQYRTKEFDDNQKDFLKFKDYSSKESAIPLVTAPPQKTANISLNNIKLSVLCKFLSAVYERPIQMDNKSSNLNNISMDLKQVTLQDVMDTLLYSYNIGYEKVGKSIMVYEAVAKTKIFYIRYHGLDRKSVTRTTVNAYSKKENSLQNKNTSNIETKTESTFWKDIEVGIRNIISVSNMENQPKVPVEILKDAGMILVTADPRTMNTVSQFLDRINKKSSQQVVIEVKILEITLNDDFKNGIRMDLLGKRGGGSIGNDLSGGLGSTHSQTLNSLKDFSRFNTTSPSMPSLFKALYLSGDFTSIIEALSEQGKVSVLSSPTLNVLNNHRGIIKYGRDKQFVSDVNNVTFNNNAGAQTQSGFTFETYFSGIALDTTPSIQQDGRLIMHIKPIINRVTEEPTNITVNNQKTTIPMAVVESRETDTIIAAQNGQIIIVGGITEDIVSLETSAPVPADNSMISKVLSPLKGQQSSVSKKEIMILLKPTIIDNISHDIL